jgi:hypothetical protein
MYAGLSRADNTGMTKNTNLRFRDHAIRQCEARNFPLDAVERTILQKMEENGYDGRDVAVFVGRVADRGGLIGSNGDQVWALVRGGEVITVMLRRSTQPATAAALRVDAVYGPRR